MHHASNNAFGRHVYAPRGPDPHPGGVRKRPLPVAHGAPPAGIEFIELLSG